jgi:hypothetical protein
MMKELKGSINLVLVFLVVVGLIVLIFLLAPDSMQL